MAVFTPVASAADIAAVQDILKEVFTSDKLESQMREDTWLLDQIEEVTDYTDSNGLKAVVPLHVGRSGSMGARAVGQLLPKAQHQAVARATYNYTNQYVTVKVEGPVVARMKSNRTSVVREIDFEVTRAIEDLKKDWTRQLWGRGDAVVARTLPGNAANTVIPLGAGNAFILEYDQLYAGMYVDIGTVANPQLDTGFNKIVSVDPNPAAPTITLANATAVTAGSHVFIAGNATAGVSNELNGMRLFADAALTLGNLTVAAQPKWAGVNQENGGTPRALSVDLLMTLIRTLRAGGKYPDKAAADLIQEQKYYNLLQGQVRFAGDHNLAAGDSQGLGIARIKSGFMGDADCPPGQVYIWHGGAIQSYSAGPGGWQNQTTGGDILAWSQDYDSFVARYAKYFQVGVNRRRSIGRLGDLS
jgi:hypothetical protein